MNNTAAATQPRAQGDSTMTLTVGDTDHRFGPQGVEVDKLIRRISVLTATEADELDAAWYAAAGVAWELASNPARNAARDAPPRSVQWAAWAPAWDAPVVGAPVGARRAAAWAAVALSARHRISDRGFTQKRYDTLTGPWRQTIGRVHPDDIEAT